MKRKSLPKSISILGREFKIKEVDTLIHEGVEALGTCCYSDRLILIHKDQTPTDKFNTLCHELAHTWLIITGADQFMNEREVEVHCQLLSAFVEDIVRGFQ